MSMPRREVYDRLIEALEEAARDLDAGGDEGWAAMCDMFVTQLSDALPWGRPATKVKSPDFEPEAYPWNVFERLPIDVQERLVLEAIGDRRATITEIGDAMRARSPGQWTSGDNLRQPHLRRMVRQGILGVERGEWDRCRYRYFRLSGDTIDGIDLTKLAGEES